LKGSLYSLFELYCNTFHESFYSDNDTVTRNIKMYYKMHKYFSKPVLEGKLTKHMLIDHSRLQVYLFYFETFRFMCYNNYEITIRYQTFLAYNVGEKNTYYNKENISKWDFNFFKITLPLLIFNPTKMMFERNTLF